VAGSRLREAARRLELSPGYLSELERGLKAPSVEVAGVIVRGLRLKPELGTRLLVAALPDVGRSSPWRMR